MTRTAFSPEPTPARLSTYTVRRLVVDELPLLNDLYNHCHQTDRSPAEADWLYRKNPYGEGVVFGAFDPLGRLVGVRPTTAWRFVRNGQERLAYQFTDALVAPEHRGQGIFGRLVLDMCAMAAERDVSLFSFPNSNSLPIYLRLGALDRIVRCRAMVKILAWWKYLQYRRGRDITSVPTVARATLSPICDGDLSLLPIDRFSSHFDDIHGDLGRVVANFTLRRQDFLNWRYFEHPTWRYQVALVRRGDETHGYVVVRMMRQVAHVIDVFIRPEPSIVAAVPRLLTRWAKQLQAIAIYFDASKGHLFEQAFRRNGFLLRRTTGTIVMDTRSVRHLVGAPASSGDGRALYFTTGDSDTR
jgi:GNAT superfamily N-acetyltransferase